MQTIRKIIIAFAVFFAAGFTTSANAQSVCDGMATFDIFAVPSTTLSWTDDNPTWGGYTSFTGTIAEVLSAANYVGTFTHFQVVLRTPEDDVKGGWSSTNTVPSPVFQNPADVMPAAGDLLRWQNDSFDGNNELALRVYERADSELALTDLTATMKTCAGQLTTGQFFLTDGWAETTTAATTNIGYTAPNCTGATRAVTNNGLGCRARNSNADCPTTAPYFDSTETDPANECRLPTDDNGNGDMECVSVYGDAQPIFDATATQPDNCRPRESNADCPTTAPYFNSTETDLANQCRLPTNADGNGDAECLSVYGDAQPIFDATATQPNNCRPRESNADCPTTAPYFDSTETVLANQCRLPTDDDGNGDTECASINSGAEPIFDDMRPNNCRSLGDSDCPSGEIARNNVCVNPACEPYEVFDDTAKTCNDRTKDNCTGDQVFQPVNTGGICTSAVEFLNTESIAADNDSYTAAKCRVAGWMVAYSVQTDTRENAAEICGIPVARDDNLATAAALESQPQLAPGGMANGCIIRMSPGFDVANSTPDISNAVPCNSDNLFGGDGEFPQMPAGFNLATDMLAIAVVPNGKNQVFFNGVDISEVVSEPEPQATNTQTQPAEKENEALEQFAYIGAGAVVVVAAATFIQGGGFPVFDFAPDFGYRITESGYAANAGGRLDFRKDNWHLYYSGGQTNTDGEFGDFRYTSGGKYQGDLFSATFSESVAGETADYDFSLSANLTGGIWKISPNYRLHSEYENGEFTTRNSLNLTGDFRYNGWTINPSAGFRWENTDNFADNARFQINAIHRF